MNNFALFQQLCLKFSLSYPISINLASKDRFLEDISYNSAASWSWRILWACRKALVSCGNREISWIIEQVKVSYGYESFLIKLLFSNKSWKGNFSSPKFFRGSTECLTFEKKIHSVDNRSTGRRKKSGRETEVGALPLRRYLNIISAGKRTTCTIHLRVNLVRQELRILGSKTWPAFSRASKWTNLETTKQGQNIAYTSLVRSSPWFNTLPTTPQSIIKIQMTSLFRNFSTNLVIKTCEHHSCRAFKKSRTERTIQLKSYNRLA